MEATRCEFFSRGEMRHLIDSDLWAAFDELHAWDLAGKQGTLTATAKLMHDSSVWSEEYLGVFKLWVAAAQGAVC
jgi:hypothetical protein